MKWLRKPGKGMALIAIVGLAGALSAIGLAAGATTVTISESNGIKPSKLPKQRYKPASLHVVVSSEVDTPGEFPVAVTNTRIDFDDDGKITTKGLKRCTANLANTTTEQARNMCRPSMIGTGNADALIPPNVPTHAIVTAFNGPPQGGNPTILLHARTDVGITQVLTGTIDPNGASGDYGARLNVPVPPLPAGAVLTRFETTVKKSWNFRGKRYNYIKARCKDGNKTLNMKAVIQLASGPNQTPSDTQKCRVAR
jgi:hypothetical protein